MSEIARAEGRELRWLPTRFLSLTFYSLSGFFLFSSLLIYLVLPSRIVRNAIGFEERTYEILFSSGLFISVAGLSFSALLCAFFRLSPIAPVSDQKADFPLPAGTKWPRVATLAAIILSLWILGFAIREAIYTAMSQDEVGVVEHVLQGHFNPFFSPLSHLSHSLSTILCWFFMKLFGGFSKLVVRLPALLFTALFLSLILLFVKRHFTILATLLLLAHLSSNEFFLWFTHSMRGYIFAMFFLLGLFLTVLELTQVRLRHGNKMLWIFGLGFGVSICVHTFCAVFAIFLLASLILWYVIHWHKLRKVQRLFAQRTVLIGLGWLPVHLPILILHAIELRSLGYINEVQARTVLFLGTLDDLLGIGRDWGIRTLIVTLIGLAIFRFFPNRSRTLSLLDIFVGLSGLLLSVAFPSLGAVSLEPRLLFPFLPFLLLFLGQSIVSVAEKKARYALLGLTLFTLVLVPWRTSRGYLEHTIPHFAGHEAFALRVRSLLSDEKNCFSFSGESGAEVAFRLLYLHDLIEEPYKRGPCLKSYHFYFQKSHYGATHPPRLPEDGTYDLIFSDGDGRFLYKKN